MISQGFVSAGAKVYIASRDAKACQKTADELNALGKGTVPPTPCESTSTSCLPNPFSFANPRSAHTVSS